jgi:hypothetical protein
VGQSKGDLWRQHVSMEIAKPAGWNINGVREYCASEVELSCCSRGTIGVSEVDLYVLT